MDAYFWQSYLLQQFLERRIGIGSFQKSLKVVTKGDIFLLLLSEYPILHSVFPTSHWMAHLFLPVSVQEDAP